MAKIASIILSFLTCCLIATALVGSKTMDNIIVDNSPVITGETENPSENPSENPNENEDENEEDEDEDGETSPLEEGTKPCPDGKFLNPKTNRCKNLQEITETSTGKTITTYDPETGEGTTVKICNEGYYLNLETNRCNKEKSESTVSETSTKTCPEGKFLNPKTNRCKNLQEITESTTGKTITTYDPETGEGTTEKICNDGYELDQDSNRCKKVKINEGEDYKIEVPNLGESSGNNFVAIGSVITIISVGIGFIIFQFRHEIMKVFKKIRPGKKA